LNAHPVPATAQPISRILPAPRNRRRWRGLVRASRKSFDPGSIVPSLLMIPVFVPLKATPVPLNSHGITTEVLPSLRRFVHCCKASSGLRQDCNLSGLLHTTLDAARVSNGARESRGGPSGDGGGDDPEPRSSGVRSRRLWTFRSPGARQTYFHSGQAAAALRSDGAECPALRSGNSRSRHPPAPNSTNMICPFRHSGTFPCPSSSRRRRTGPRLGAPRGEPTMPHGCFAQASRAHELGSCHAAVE